MVSSRLADAEARSKPVAAAVTRSSPRLASSNQNTPSTRKHLLAVPGAGPPSDENALGAPPPVTADGGEGIALRTVGEELREMTGEQQLANGGGTGRGARRCRRLLSAFRRRREGEQTDAKSTTASVGDCGADSVVVPKGRTRSSTPSLTVKECKATRTLGVIMGAFTACWLPFFVSDKTVDHSPVRTIGSLCYR